VPAVKRGKTLKGILGVVVQTEMKKKAGEKKKKGKKNGPRKAEKSSAENGPNSITRKKMSVRMTIQ